MSTRNEDHRPLAWQGTLAQMRQYGTRVALACIGPPDCRRWQALDLDQLVAEFGESHMLWNRSPPCPACGGRSRYMASPGPSTPFRPLAGGLEAEAMRKAFLKSFGFTRRDIRRIQALAEATTASHERPALGDLDVPFRVGACAPGREGYTSGLHLGEWQGRTLVYWTMNDAEAEIWRRKRRTGPKALPEAGPPPVRRHESQADYQAREAYLQRLCEPRSDWAERGEEEVARILAGLGVRAPLAKRILGMAERLDRGERGEPVETAGFRFALCPRDRYTGEPLGIAGAYVVVAFTISPR